MAATQSATDLKKAISRFLAENQDSPVAGELRRVERSLGGGTPSETPGQRAAREAATPSKPDAENPAENVAEGGQEEPGDARPGTPGHDMNNPSTPGGNNPFGGIKKRSTAKQLARLRFKQKAGRP